MLDIDSVIKDGIKKITDKQKAGGDFNSLSSVNPANFTDALSYSTTFFTAIILTCLNAVAENGQYRQFVDPARSKAAGFLLREKSVHWSFNYWSRAAQERKIMPYPDDIDDTFNAIVALIRYDNTIIDGEALAAIAAMLTSVETEEGGPYRTWLISPPGEKWADVDLAANSTVGYFLALAGIRLPHLETLIDDATTHSTLQSPYYPSAAHVLYFISRFYNNHKDNSVVQKAVTAVLAFRKAHHKEMTPLESAMTITALINLGAVEAINRNEVEKLLIKERREGWKPYTFCIDPAREGATSYAGASALTAAIFLEMAVLYNSAHAQSKTKPEKRNNIQRHEQIVTQAKIDLGKRELNVPLKNIIEKKIDAIANGSITLLAHEFKDALGTHGVKIKDEQVDQLALGNLYGWIAYDIYDDILDGEGDPSLLPVANICLRALTHIYEKEEVVTPGCIQFFNNIMDSMENANAWEQKHCRLPAGKRNSLPAQLPDFSDYRNLADRSIGHAMGPLAELMIAGYDPASPCFQSIMAMFRHYLIARQLHDDAHDWADDLLRGHVNSVGAIVIKSFQTKHKNQARAKIVEALPTIREIFWKETVDAIAKLIRQHINAAQIAREQSGLISEKNFMEGALATLDAGAKRAIAERDDALLFLAHYHSSAPRAHSTG